MNQNFSNPFFQQEDSSSGEAEAVADQEQDQVFNVRYVTNSPAEEYEQREGQVHSLPIAFQAMLCDARKGRCTVTEKGVTLSRSALVGNQATGEKVVFYDPDSPLCHDLGRTDGLKCFYVYNPAKPDLIHLLDKDSGSYLGSLPAQNRPGFRDTKALQKEYQEQLRVQRRYTDRLQQLSQERSSEALDRARQNTETLQRAVNTLDLDKSSRPAPAEPAQTVRDISARTEEIEEAQRNFQEVEEIRDQLLSRRQINSETPAAPTYDPYNK